MCDCVTDEGVVVLPCDSHLNTSSLLLSMIGKQVDEEAEERLP